MKTFTEKNAAFFSLLPWNQNIEIVVKFVFKFVIDTLFLFSVKPVIETKPGEVLVVREGEPASLTCQVIKISATCIELLPLYKKIC